MSWKRASACCRQVTIVLGPSGRSEENGWSVAARIGGGWLFLLIQPGESNFAEVIFNEHLHELAGWRAYSQRNDVAMNAAPRFLLS